MTAGFWIGEPGHRRVILRTEDIDSVRSHHALIDQLIAEAQAAQQRAQMLYQTAEYTGQALMRRLVYDYGLPLDNGEEWRLDLDHVQMVEVSVGTPATAPQQEEPQAAEAAEAAEAQGEMAAAEPDVIAAEMERLPAPPAPDPALLALPPFPAPAPAAAPADRDGPEEIAAQTQARPRRARARTAKNGK